VVAARMTSSAIVPVGLNFQDVVQMPFVDHAKPI
jgi:hypothetical protein